jgi:hypothetical protein
MKSTQLTL